MILSQLQTYLTDLKAQLASESTLREDRILVQEQQVHELKRKLNAMTSEFSRMLQSSLSLLKDKLAEMASEEERKSRAPALLSVMQETSSSASLPINM